MTAFTDLDLDPRVLKAVTETGYETPTPIQAQAIPHALQGRDVLGIAQTGTGKTASFVLPMLTLLAKGRARARMPRSLVLAPTRELAAQVAENFNTYSKNVRLNMALLIGGTSFKDQDRLIDRGVDVLIATPGRLLDHFERGKLMLTGIEIMVVDEADRMLDMGFIPDIERIFKLTPFTRQTMFYSATMAPEITRITQEFLSNPVRVEVARQATAAETIEQFVCKHTPSRRDRADSEKRDVLRALIDAEGEKLTNGIIFCNRKRDVDVLAKSLKKYGYDAGPIHGDLDQSVRTRTLDGFRNGELRLLVASDVAARGLDIPAVSHVFNYDIPIHAEDYVHRIGRTGRAGRSGKALSLHLPADEKHLEKIEELLEKKIPVIDSPLGKAQAAPAPAAEDAPPASNDDKPAARRSRTRKRPQKDDAPQPQAAADSDAAPAAEPAQASAPAAEAPTAEALPAEKPQPKGRGRKTANRGGEGKVVGMGDHVPAFLTRDLRAALADLEGTDPAGEDPAETDNAPGGEGAETGNEGADTAAEAGTADTPAPKPARKTRTRKSGEAAQKKRSSRKAPEGGADTGAEDTVASETAADTETGGTTRTAEAQDTPAGGGGAPAADDNAAADDTAARGASDTAAADGEPGAGNAPSGHGRPRRKSRARASASSVIGDADTPTTGEERKAG